MTRQATAPASMGRWYRGNLHMHSLWSDGQHFAEMAAAYYKAAGYQFIAFTEHDCFQVGEKWLPTTQQTLSGKPLGESEWWADYLQRFGPDWVQRAQRQGQECVRLRPLAEYRTLLEEPERFLILNGEEVTVKSPQATHWINVYNAPQPVGGLQVPRHGAEAIDTLVAHATAMEEASGNPILVSFNHPNYRWNATAEDISAATTLGCFEIHTALNSTRSYGDAVHPGAERIWDIVLAQRLSQSQGRVIYGLASDDCHLYPARSAALSAEQQGALPCRAWVMVHATELTPAALIAALRQGAFYASSGVSLDAVAVETSSLRVRIQSEPGVRYTTHFIGTRRTADLRSRPGRTNDVTQQYSAQVGETLATVTGTAPIYQFTGDELYVRAVVSSDRLHPNPTIPGDITKAWVQPVVP
jgi:hypothetical protein